MAAEKVVHISVPVATEVLNANPDAALVITVDTRKQNVHQRLGLPTRTRLHFGRENEFFAEELSGLAWPIRYRVRTRDGYYLTGDGERVHFTTSAGGLDARRGASLVLMRAAVLLVIVGGMGYRRAAWLMKELFLVDVSKSTLCRWTQEIAASLPSGDEMIRALHEQKPIRQYSELGLYEVHPVSEPEVVQATGEHHHPVPPLVKP